MSLSRFIKPGLLMNGTVTPTLAQREGSRGRIHKVHRECILLYRQSVLNFYKVSCGTRCLQLCRILSTDISTKNCWTVSYPPTRKASSSPTKSCSHERCILSTDISTASTIKNALPWSTKVYTLCMFRITSPRLFFEGRGHFCMSTTCSGLSSSVGMFRQSQSQN